ncbi:tyrosine-type recombinase/integrase [Luteimonas sp. 3794]|uniref:tyrosine-type recombinase/integrase n=1 Tax=Luteimonas sp. 3794 TaxID=2817730 RepID=UPI0028623BE8|nr:tyrosine-type recombinase/integrase [Luteimonas sp. 3794]MDR6990224.1 integrase [Luteimonas sp. 3794]
MATVVRFYRWLKSTKLLSAQWPMWNERQIGIRLKDGFGFEHTLRVTSTDLSIPNRRPAGSLTVEEGLLPVSIDQMNEILRFARRAASEETWLMLLLGFRSGLRIGTIADLKVQTLTNASVDPIVGWHRIAVGPGARPPVATKFGVSGMVPILDDVLDEIRRYSTSTRRLKRQALAEEEDRDLVFLNRFGQPYGSDESRAINVAMSRLRSQGRSEGVGILRDFHFHRTRATFATELMRAALSCMSARDAIDLVRESCLHRDEATTFRYVKFIERTAAMAEAADAFTEAFLGLARGQVALRA